VKPFPQGGGQVLDLFAETSRAVGSLVLEGHLSGLTALNHPEGTAQSRLSRVIEILKMQDRVRQVLMALTPEISFGTLPEDEHVTLISTGLAMPANRVPVDQKSPSKTVNGITKELRLPHVLKGLGDSRRSVYVVEGYDPALISEATQYVQSVLDQFGGRWTVSKPWAPIKSRHIGMVLSHD